MTNREKLKSIENDAEKMQLQHEKLWERERNLKKEKVELNKKIILEEELFSNVPFQVNYRGGFYLSVSTDPNDSFYRQLTDVGDMLGMDQYHDSCFLNGYEDRSIEFRRDDDDYIIKFDSAQTLKDFIKKYKIVIAENCLEKEIESKQKELKDLIEINNSLKE